VGISTFPRWGGQGRWGLRAWIGIEADVILIDECSTIASDVMAHIRQHLKGRGLLYSGDPAQLPPVGEAASKTFATKSHLDEIVRQATARHPDLGSLRWLRRAPRAVPVMDDGHGGLHVWARRPCSNL
jgi:hypothetical protein